MLRNYYINREWLLSSTSKAIYRWAAALSLFLVVIRIEHRLRGDALFASELSLALFEAMLLVGVVGAAVTLVAMEYYFFVFDDSSTWKKALWFVAMIFVPLGPALYCFFVYSRSKHFQAVESASEPIASN
jgi:hypothetical protein